jgi:integrase
VVEEKQRLTKTFVDSIPFPVTGQKFYWDSDMECFGVRVTPGCKSYIVQSRVNGRTVRPALGRHGKLTAELARQLARKKLGELAQGVDVNQKKAERKVKAVTVGEVWERYKGSKNLRPKTLEGYEYVFKLSLSDWSNKPMNSINKDMIEVKYKMIASTIGPRSKEGGAKGLANATMRLFRSLWNFAADVYEDSQGTSVFGSNPVQRLKGQWHKLPRRKGHVPKHRLADFLNAVDAIPNEVIRDYVRILLFTGLRKTEAASLRWVDLELHPEMKNVLR